jgi:2-iminobutanoate/2-iminopropanoate deaminase
MPNAGDHQDWTTALAGASVERISPEGHWDWHVPTPFAQAIKVGPLVFVGGQLSADQDGAVVGRGDIEVQTRNVFENVTRLLREAGASWEDVVKLNTYYTYDGPPEEAQEYWEKMTRVRLDYLPAEGPAATAVRVPGLMYDGFLIEADCIAVLGNGPGSRGGRT